ncbi:MAG: RDD family protein [Acidobacteriota bacterium]|nr:RDD family protein [Acidobacteriota bacterium]
MINDSVREDLIGKVSARLNPVKHDAQEFAAVKKILPPPVKTLSNAAAAAEKPIVSERLETTTANIAAQPTNPTLVEFHSKNAAIPEWRLQLKNRVRQHQVPTKTDSPNVSEAAAPMPRATLVTSGANALKAEVVEQPRPAIQKNPDLARALERIEKSRRKFLIEEPTPTLPTTPKAGKNYPFYIAAKTNEADIQPAEVSSPVASFAKPKLAVTPKSETQKLDTNKLPSVAAHIADSFAASSVAEKAAVLTGKTSVQQISRNEEAGENAEFEEYDDCPTFAMRFNAGLFDLIIGTFVSFCLLAPFMLMGGTWLSGTGFLALAATVAVVMFVYLTTAIGFYGRTFGMRLFSLELIDIEGEEYPSFHQAAVSSSVYLLSLAFGGLGFLTVFFNEEKRAAHDLASKTIVVKE